MCDESVFVVTGGNIETTGKELQKRFGGECDEGLLQYLDEK